MADAGPGIAPTPVTRKPRRRWFVVVVAAAVVVVLLLVLPLLGTWGLPYHFACKRGAKQWSADLWTPVALVNSPFNGSANATGVLMGEDGPIAGAAGSIEAANGSSEGLFALVPWTIYPTSTYLELGAGSPTSCTGSFVAVMASFALGVNPLSDVTPIQLAGPGSHVTQAVSTGFTLDGYRSVEWNLSYNLSVRTVFGHGNCGGGGFGYFPVATELNVTIPSPDGNLGVVVPSIQLFSYYLRPNGNWLIQTSPSGAWAFDYYSCFPGTG